MVIFTFEMSRSPSWQLGNYLSRSLKIVRELSLNINRNGLCDPICIVAVEVLRPHPDSAYGAWAREGELHVYRVLKCPTSDAATREYGQHWPSEWSIET